MSREDGGRNAPCRMDRAVDRDLYVRVAAMSRVQRVRWMVNGQKKARVFRRSIHLIDEPALLLASAARVEAAVDIGVQADDLRERSFQRPVHVRLGHRRSVRAGWMARRIAEVAHEPEERWLGVDRIAAPCLRVAVVIARDRKDRGMEILIGLVELTDVQTTQTVEIDDVAEVVEKCGGR